LPSDADDIERHPCPRCAAEPGSPCRSRGGAVAGSYHTGRFTKVPRLAKLLVVPTPANRGPGQPYLPGRRGWRKIRARNTAEAIIGAITGLFTYPSTLLLGRYTSSGELRKRQPLAYRRA
jgi:hypothetical protein